MIKIEHNPPTKLSFTVTDTGLKVQIKEGIFNLSYPPPIWQNYPKAEKAFLVDNLSYLLTSTFPLVSGFKNISYNTSYPLFKPFFKLMIIRDIPSSTEDYNISTSEILRNFLNLETRFTDLKIKKPVYRTLPKKERVILPLSFGKDSLLTLALAREIGLEPICIYINDTVSRVENKLKLKTVKEISKKFRVNCFPVKNELENLNDFEYWHKNESSLGYSHMIAGFCFIALPFAHFYKAKYIILGNQKDMNFIFMNKEGYRAFPSFDQSLEGTKQLDAIIKIATRDKVNVTSLIEPLTNLAIMKILHHRYPALGKLEISCDALNTLNVEERWCLNCSKCARLYIFMKAWGINTQKLGFTRGLLGKNSERFYTLFSGRETDNYEKSEEARDEQLLAFYLAYKRGVRGYLIDKFKKRFLNEAQSREKSLTESFLKPHSLESLPENLREKIKKIYFEELNGKLY